MVCETTYCLHYLFHFTLLLPPPHLPLTDLRARSTECGGSLLQSESSGVTACADSRPRLRPLPGGRGYSTWCPVWRCSLLLSGVLYSSLQQWLMLCCSNSYDYKFVRVPPKAAHFSFRKVTAFGVLCYFALFACLTFLPSHLLLKHVYPIIIITKV